MSTEDVLNRAEEVVLVPIGELIPHPKNMNKHTEDQINRLVKLIKYQGMRNPIIVQKGTSLIVAGHGRLEALKKMGAKKVPVIYQEFEDEAQLYAYMVSDNAINSNQWGGGLDLSLINTEMLDLGPDFDIDMLGIKDFVIEMAEKDNEDPLKDNPYTLKVKAPIYEPKGEMPDIKDLVDESKTKELLEKISKLQAPKEVKEFLKIGAYRHNVFNYQLIAEYYAHASQEVQSLMEDSALVIVDFEKAIESGFVKLANDLAEIFTEDDDDDE